MKTLQQPHIVNLIRLKAVELGQQLTDEQVLAVLRALEWMQQKLTEKKS